MSKLVRGLGAVIVTAAASLLPQEAQAQNCLSQNPADWPPPAKPYFMVIQDTSGSMIQCTNPVTSFPQTCASNATPNSCGLLPSRLNDAKCALRQVVQAFSGEVNFGLATFIPSISGCDAGVCDDDCVNTGGSGCDGNGTDGEDYDCTWSGVTANSCGFVPGCAAATPGLPNLPAGTWRNGGRILVPMKQDLPSAPDNTAQLLEWFDGNCDANRELFAKGNTPIAGSLESVTQYLRAGWTPWDNTNYCASNLSYAFPTPMTASDPPCRSLNVILVTDGDDTCEGGSGTAFSVAAAADLHDNGVTIGGTNWPVNVYVINFAGGVQANTDQIAAAGGTGASLFAADEVELAQSLAAIVSGAVAPEVCNNSDDNCNGCVDEGYKHYCNQGQTCCSWSNQTQRDACFNGPSGYFASITPADPDGDLTKLPCTTQAQAGNSNTWLCYNPGDPCDNADNNCDAGVDEGANKCGTPAHCPLTETCNTQDDDCDGLTDEGGVCGTCTATAEVCDGCDNDCDGVVDDGIAPVPCGLTTPANCSGTKACVLSGQPVAPGGCLANGGFGPCNNNPGTEICDGVDNDCDGLADDGIAATPCGPPGLNYGPNSHCKQGLQACGGQCIGAVGPTTEICDGIDNDCDFQVDEGNLPGVGQGCGVSTPPCQPGITACVNGAIVCQGGVQPQGEQCDGIDNNCNGLTDEAPLVDAPLPNQTGCWNIPGNACAHDNLSWSPPPGGNCFDAGSLQSPCSAGTLSCAGGQGWVCLGGNPPAAEVCDGVDNDCDGTPDDGSFPTEGQICGLAAPQNPVPAGCTPGDCVTGVIDCQAGFLDCVGDVGPSAEICNGKDDNCDGTCDNGIPIGAACEPVYDTAQYPDTDPSVFPCQLGHLECDGLGGLICVGALGPNPEVCDGNDNDCDSSTDESGTAPNGIDGTADPNDPSHVLGAACPEDMTNVCSPGQYACLNGLVQCVGVDSGTFEACDCQDNDCNGVTDNPNPNDTPPLCSPGKDCVNANGSCQCATPCTGEFCPAGQACTDVFSSETGRPLGKYCISDNCGECSTKTVTDANQNVLCAPAGTVLADCYEPPVCSCKDQNGCQAPCFGVTCTAPEVCANYGPNAGQCAPANCFNNPCPGCDTACNDAGECVTNPCADFECAPGEVKKPNDDFTACECQPSCAGVMCPSDQICQDGLCVATCVPACAADQYCDMTQNPPACVDSLCEQAFCESGACCDPATGECGSCPCEGVICPEGQVCSDGECTATSTGEGGGSNTTATTGTGTGPAGPGGTGASGEGAGDASGVWGLATGGGGCSCETAGGSSRGEGMALVGLGLALAALRRRTKTGARGKTEEVAK